MPKKTKHPPKKGADPAPYRFTEPVVRVLSDKKNGKFGPRGKTEAGQSSGPKPRVAVFHKRKDKSVNANVIGTRNLSVWKKSSGRSKSWKACKRLKLTQGYLELLTNSNGHSVSFGWRFSTTKTPTSFVRGQRIYVNKKPKPRCTEKSSGALILKELDEEDKKGFPLPRGRPYKGKWRVGQESQQEVALTELPKRFFRVFVGPSTFSKTEESFPGRVTFATRQSLPVLVHNPEFQNDITPRDFVILDLVHNDSLADVYLVQKFEDSSWSYYAHVFLNEGFGNNWRRYRQRKMDRMRQSNDFQAEMVQFNKHIIVMKASSEVDNAFHFKNTQLEFPPLPGSGEHSFSLDTVCDELTLNDADRHICSS